MPTRHATRDRPEAAACEKMTLVESLHVGSLNVFYRAIINDAVRDHADLDHVSKNIGHDQIVFVVVGAHDTMPSDRASVMILGGMSGLATIADHKARRVGKW